MPCCAARYQPISSWRQRKFPLHPPIISRLIQKQLLGKRNCSKLQSQRWLELHSLPRHKPIWALFFHLRGFQSRYQSHDDQERFYTLAIKSSSIKEMIGSCMSISWQFTNQDSSCFLDTSFATPLTITGVWLSRLGIKRVIDADISPSIVGQMVKNFSSWQQPFIIFAWKRL